MIIKQINHDIKEYNGIKFSIGLSVEFFPEKGEKQKQVFGQYHGEQSAVLDSSNKHGLKNSQIWPLV